MPHHPVQSNGCRGATKPVGLKDTDPTEWFVLRYDLMTKACFAVSSSWAYRGVGVPLSRSIQWSRCYPKNSVILSGELNNSYVCPKPRQRKAKASSGAMSVWTRRSALMIMRRSWRPYDIFYSHLDRKLPFPSTIVYITNPHSCYGC